MPYTTHDVVLKYKNRFNKSDSQDYDNLWWYQIEESFYKGQLEVIRRIKKGKTQKQESDEETSDVVDDLQVLLNSKPVTLPCSEKGLYVLTSKLPSDYLYYKRLSPKCTKGNCLNINIKSYMGEEANVDDLLVDYNSQPSFNFEQTFHTLSGNKFKIYHNKDFEIKEAELIYYRYPSRPKFDKTRSYTFEFKDDMIELFIDEGIKILSGDMENLNQNTLAQNRVNENN